LEDFLKKCLAFNLSGLVWPKTAKGFDHLHEKATNRTEIPIFVLIHEKRMRLRNALCHFNLLSTYDRLALATIANAAFWLLAFRLLVVAVGFVRRKVARPRS